MLRFACFSTLYGSKWVATSPPGRVSAVSSCFSTLYGSKWVATRKMLPLVVSSPKFQYPLRVEVGCNMIEWEHSEQLHAFQYPLRVEVGCNHRASASETRGGEFQYPLRVEVGCNLAESHRSDFAGGSFSTLYGSKWVATRESCKRFVLV